MGSFDVSDKGSKEGEVANNDARVYGRFRPSLAWDTYVGPLFHVVPRFTFSFLEKRE